MPHLPDLVWQSVLLVNVICEPFTGTFCGLQMSRLHLALHPDGIFSPHGTCLSNSATTHVRLVGWKPARDVPFDLPVRFERKGDGRVSALIPNGTWVLPYDDEQHRLYLRLQRAWHSLMSYIDSAPHSPFTLGFIRSLVATSTHSPNLN